MGRGVTMVAAVAAVGLATVSADAVQAKPIRDRVTVIEYDSFGGPGGYTVADYEERWGNPFGPGEGERTFDGDTFVVDATPYTTAADFGVFDHIKYLRISNQSFSVPEHGSVEFSVDIDADTPGTVPGRVVHGTYGPPGSYPNGAPYEATVTETQQAFVTLNMVDFATGQLFDWLVTDDSASTLIERLPSSVTGSPVPAGRDEMYTQIITEHPITPGPHNYAIRLTRNRRHASVEYLIDGRVVDRVNQNGVPLDRQHQRFTGTYPSLGPGEELAEQIDTVVIGHGLFSLLDAFPFQHPESPELSVSIPVEERIFGQGARAEFDNFVVTIEDKTQP